MSRRRPARNPQPPSRRKYTLPGAIPPGWLAAAPPLKALPPPPSDQATNPPRSPPHRPAPTARSPARPAVVATPTSVPPPDVLPLSTVWRGGRGVRSHPW
jgi:hypothetical protein